MTPEQLDACLDHLRAAESLLEAVGDVASLGRLALVIDLLREAHGLPPRQIGPDGESILP